MRILDPTGLVHGTPLRRRTRSERTFRLTARSVANSAQRRGRLPNELGSHDGGPVVGVQRLFERVEREVGVADGLGHSALETAQWRQQLVEEIVDDGDDQRPSAGPREVGQRLTTGPRLPRLVRAQLVLQLLKYNPKSTRISRPATR